MKVRAMDQLIADSGKEIFIMPIIESARGMFVRLRLRALRRM